MKKLLKFLIPTVLFSAMFSTVVFADVDFDTKNAENGTVSVKYDGSLSVPIKIVVKKASEQYVYALKNNKANTVPLQMGAGEYSIALMEQVSGTKYKPVKSESVSVSSIDEAAMYTASIMIIDYAPSTKAIPYYKTLAKGKKGEEQIKAIYDDAIANYSYDFDKAKNVVKDYVPTIDSTFVEKKGICYDYSALVAGSLRSQGVPTRLIMGYAPDISEYHAWNQVMMNGKWVTIDTTSDAQYLKAKQPAPMAKDSSKYKVVKIY